MAATATGQPLTQSDAIASLLSLALEGSPIQGAPIKVEQGSSLSQQQHLLSGSVGVGAGGLGVPGAVGGTPGLGGTPSTSVPVNSSLSTGNGGKHHRRLSSTSKSKRRLSDAREAANRPSPSLLTSNLANHTNANLSMASLSLSSSPPSNNPNGINITNTSGTHNGISISTSLSGASRTLAPAPAKGIPISSSLDDDEPTSPTTSASNAGSQPISIPTSSRSGKKRGMDHKCESCSKIYRHPSCLIKHRWEHTPHWREASKFVLSKHQQVQLLEAAAILSHMSPSQTGGRSLPDDRSLWPSFLSGGSLPPPEPPIPTSRLNGTSHPASANVNNGGIAGNSGSAPRTARGVSSSVPSATGPRLHDYGVAGTVTTVRPGLVGVTNGSGGVVVIPDRSTSVGASEGGRSTGSQPMAVPGSRHTHNASWGGGSYNGVHGSYGPGSYAGHGAHSYGHSLPHGSYTSTGLSLPNSSVRSGSSPDESSRSRSRSGSIEGSDDEMEDGADLIIEEEEEEDNDERGIRIVGSKGLGVGVKGGEKTRDAYRAQYDYALREESDEDMADDMDGVGRIRPSRTTPSTVSSRTIRTSTRTSTRTTRSSQKVKEQEEEWDGMDMDMDMD